MKKLFIKYLCAVFALAAASFMIITPSAMALVAGDDVTGALTGADQTAGQTTGVGQVVQPIIPSPLSPAPPSKRELETTVPYPRPPAPAVRTKGSYYGTDVKEGGKYYPEGVRVEGKYTSPELPSEAAIPAEEKPPETVQPATPPNPIQTVPK